VHILGTMTVAINPLFVALCMRARGDQGARALCGLSWSACARRVRASSSRVDHGMRAPLGHSAHVVAARSQQSARVGALYAAAKPDAAVVYNDAGKAVGVSSEGETAKVGVRGAGCGSQGSGSQSSEFQGSHVGCRVQ